MLQNKACRLLPIRHMFKAPAPARMGSRHPGSQGLEAFPPRLGHPSRSRPWVLCSMLGRQQLRPEASRRAWGWVPR